MLSARTTILALTTVTLMAAGCGGSTKTNTTTVAAGTTPTTPTATTAQVTGATTGQINAHPFPVADVKVAHGKPLAHQQWVKKANAICAHYHKELKNIKIKSEAEIPRVFPQESAYLRSETAKLAKLTPPTSNKSDWQQIVNTVLELAEGTAKVGQISNPGPHVLTTPIGMAVVATSHHLTDLSVRNKLLSCAI
jgi:cytochrome c553